MYVGNGDDIINKLMQIQGNCPNCGTTLTFKESALLAKDHGIKEDAVMCHNCHKIYTINLSPNQMSFVDEIKTETVNAVDDSAIKEETKYATNFKKEIKNNIQPPQQQIGTGANNIDNSIKKNIDDKQQKDEEDSYFSALFYKRDVKTNELRISKTKTISIIFFLIAFIFFLMALLMNPITDNAVTIIGSVLILFIFALLLTAPVFIVGYIISYVLDREAEKNKQQSKKQEMPQQETVSQNTNEEKPVQQQNISQEKPVVENTNAEQYFESDNMGTRHDTIEKANAYWLGERFQMEIKPPFTLYQFKSGNDAEKALLELPYIHKAKDTGNLICDYVYIFGCYKVSEGNYEAIICGKDLSYEDFIKAEESFNKHGGELKNNLEPEKTNKKEEKPKSDKKENSVKFREKINQNQFTYECYDADTKEDALAFLKEKTVNQRLYYVCVYTPEGNYGRDIDGIYQM